MTTFVVKYFVFVHLLLKKKKKDFGNWVCQNQCDFSFTTTENTLFPQFINEPVQCTIVLNNLKINNI